jgi:phenylacetate-CoA ligase
MQIFRRIRTFLLLEVALPIADFFMNTHVNYYFHQISDMNKWDEKDITQWQNNRLNELITHFYNNTSYYKRLFDELNLKPDDIRCIDDLKKIPPINKDLIRKHYNELIPKNFKKIKHKNASTGGSSGKPLKYLLDLKSWSYTTAIKIYSWQTTGYLYGDAYATVGSSSLFPQTPSLKHRLYHKFKRSLLISSMNLSNHKIEEHLKEVKHRNIEYLYGYASGLFLIAKYMNQHNIKINTIKGCFPTSEMLLPEYRNEMEKAFGFVMDCYGARDGGITAYEIHKGYYNIGYNSLAEINNPYEKDTGNLLVTDLLNYAFPLIRYEIGDDVTLPKNKMEFNYNGQVVTKILGRSPDIIKLDNGRVITGPAFQMMFGRFNVLAYRIAKVNGKKVKVEIQADANFVEDEEKQIRQILSNQFGEDCEIELLRVDNFEPNQNGKRNYFMA